jgi:hypothetical protein
LKKLSNFFIKISDFFYGELYNWIENDLSEFSKKIGYFLFKFAKKLYPNNFCHHCGLFLEQCYHPPLKDPPQYYCCNCYHTIYKEQY